jgi:hypothetical protein
MNNRLAQYFLFRNKRRPWYERPFKGMNKGRLWSALGGVGLGAGVGVGIGLGLGAGLMYMLDPDRGKDRRAIARDKVSSAMSRTGESISRTSHDLKERARGVIAETGSFFHRSGAARENELM